MRKLMLAAAALIGLASVAHADPNGYENALRMLAESQASLEKAFGGAEEGLTEAQQFDIGAQVVNCMSDTTVPPGVRTNVFLDVTTNSSGIVRKVMVSDDSVRDTADPAYRGFAERVIRAVIDPKCSKLPLPASMQGKV